MKSMLMAIMAVAVAVTFSAPAFPGDEGTEKKDEKKGGHVLEIERPGAQRGVLWSDGILTLDVTDLGDRAIFAGVLAAAVGVEVEVVP